MGRYARFSVGFVLLVAGLLVRAQFATAPVNEWVSSADLSISRSAACSVRLADGRVLIAGGSSQFGSLNTVDIYTAAGSISAAAPMLEARADAACAAMPDGRVLMTGGTDGRSALASAEIYDPSTDTWTAAASMTAPRVGHTATVSPWGAIIIVGGEPTGTVEAYTTSGLFVPLGRLETARTDYAVAMLPARKILFIGGSAGNAPTTSIEMYDADTNLLAPAGSLLTARKSLAASTLYDGTVLISGGIDAGGNYLATTEIFDSATGSSSQGPALGSARANHQSVLLTNNGQVLLIGGANAKGALDSTEIYSPFTSKLSAASNMHSARSAMTSVLLRRGAVVVAGGQSNGAYVSGIEQYRFATVESAKPDYQPGDTASFTGSGWRPGEQVLLEVRAFPLDQHNVEFTTAAVADSAGQIAIGGFHIDNSHLGVRFLMTATGSQSQAQTIFTDADTSQTVIAADSAQNNYGTVVTVRGTVTDTSVPNIPINFFNTITVFVDGLSAGSPQVINTGILGAPALMFQWQDTACAIPGVCYLNHISPLARTHSISAVFNCSGSSTCSSHFNDSASNAVTYNVADTVTISAIQPNASQNNSAVGTALPVSATVSGDNGFGDVSLGAVGGSAGFISFQLAGASPSNLVNLAQVLVGTVQSVNSLNADTYQTTAAFTPATNSGFQANRATGTTYLIRKGAIAANGIASNASPNNPSVGTGMTFNAYVTGTGGVVPTGTVNFRLDGAGIGSVVLQGAPGGCLQSQITGPCGLGSLPFSGSSLTGGNHTLTVDYNGDTNYAGCLASGNCPNSLTFNVAKAGTVTSVASNPSSQVNWGQTFTFTSTTSSSVVTSQSVGGQVTIKSDGSNLLNCTGVAAVAGVMTCAPSAPLSVGTHTIQAFFDPGGTTDPNFASSTSAGYPFTVNATPTTVSVSASSQPVSLGQSITYTATVTLSNFTGATPAVPGSVTIYDGSTSGTAICAGLTTFTQVGATNSYTASCTAPVAYDGSTPAKSAGPHTIVAGYSGGGQSIGSVAGAVAGSSSAPIYITINPDTLTFGTLAPSPVSVVYATNTATLAVPYTLGGTVTPALTNTFQVFKDGGATLIGNLTAAASPMSFSLNPLDRTVGTHTLVVKYPAGDANYGAAVSAAVNFTVTKATPSFTNFTFSSNPAYGTSLSLAATVGAGNAGADSPATPTGTLTFSLGSTTLASCTLSGGACTASYAGAAPTIGANTITTTYSGDANYTTLTDATHSATVVQNSGTLSLSVYPPSPVAFGTPVTFTATFTPAGGGAGFPTGTVTFTDSVGAATLGTAAFSGSSNSVSLTTSSMVPGAGRTITASWPGDTHFSAPSNAALTPYSVQPGATTVTLTPSTNNVALGGTVTYSYSVQGGPASVLPAGTITINDGGTAISNGHGTCANSGNALSGGTANSATGSCTVIYDASSADRGSGLHQVTAAYVPAGASIGVVNAATSPAQSISVAFPSVSISVPVSSAGNSFTYGTETQLSATLTPANPTPPYTGAVKFYDGGVQIASVVSATGTPQTANITLAAGSHLITAQFVGDSNYLQSPMSAALPIDVAKAASVTSSITVTSNPSTIVFGQPVALTVTVTRATGSTGNPTGNVLFTMNGNTLGSPAALQLVGGVPTASITINTLPVGANPIVATYQGDAGFGTSQSNGGTAATVTVSPDATKTVLNTGAWPAAPTYGAQITLSATVCGLAPGSSTICASSMPNPPGASITFFDGSTAIGTSSAVDASGSGSITIPMLSPPFTAVGGSSVTGSHSISARYNGFGAGIGQGDANFLQSSSPAQTLTISKGNTTSSVTSNANPSVYGQAVTLTATVLPPSAGAPLPTGTVAFTDAGNQIGIGTLVNVAGVMTATLATGTGGQAGTLSVGQHSLSVSYGGDLNYSASAAGSLSQTVGKASTATSISSNNTAANVGQQIVLTAVVTVTAPGSGTPTGSVQFINVGTNTQPLVLGTSQVAANGSQYTATLALSSLPQGSPQIYAAYSGDANFAASQSSILTQAVNKAPTSIVFSSSLNPSIYGNAVSFNIGVAPVPPNTGTPGGQIQVFDGTVNLGTYTLQAGQYNFSTASLTPGVHSISVQYGGDANFLPSTASPIQQQVTKILTSLNLSSNAITAVASQVITLTAALNPNAPPGVPFAGGQVSFYDGSTPIGVANLQSNVAALNIANLSVGLHQLQAVYNGDANWTASTSGLCPQTVTQAATQTQIVSSANPAVYGQPVTFTVAVTVPFPGTFPATGTVILSEGANTIGQPLTAASNGVFTATVLNLAPGPHNVVATFQASGSYSGSQSGQLPQVVNRASTSTAVAAVPGGAASGQAMTLMAVVSVIRPGAGAPTGTVEFDDATTGKSLGSSPLQLLGGIYTATLSAKSDPSHMLTACYSGDGNFDTSTSDPQHQSVFANPVNAVNAGSQIAGNYSPNSWLTLYGQNLADSQVIAAQSPYPSSLGGTTVTITDANGNTLQAPLYFVSPGQINMLVPSTAALGLATLTVTNSQGALASTVILITQTSPGLFTASQNGSGTAAALVQRVRAADGSQTIEPVVTFDSNGNPVPAPITVGNDSIYLQFYGTGIRYNSSLANVACSINGQNAQVLYAGPAPGFFGLDQVNVALPSGFNGHGTVNVAITVEGQAANTVTLTFQ